MIPSSVYAGLILMCLLLAAASAVENRADLVILSGFSIFCFVVVFVLSRKKLLYRK